MQISGGRAFLGDGFNDLDYRVDLICSEQYNEYIHGFGDEPGHKKGKWRRILVNLNPPAGLPKLAVRTREGYCASR